jgi:hypothetical protein
MDISSRRVRLVLALTGILAGLLALPGDAAPSPSATWTFRATGNAERVLDLDRSVELHGQELADRINSGAVAPASMIAKAGRYGGLVIRHPSGDIAAAYLHYGSSPFITVWGTYDKDFRQILRPGRYRVTVLGDKATSVRLPVTGAPARMVLATKPSAVRVAESRAGSAVHVSLAQQVRLRPTSTAVSLVWVRSGHDVPVRIDPGYHCFTPPTSSECINAPAGWTGASPGVGTDFESVSTLFTYPEGNPLSLPAGTYAVRFREINIGQPLARALFTLVSD